MGVPDAPAIKELALDPALLSGIVALNYFQVPGCGAGHLRLVGVGATDPAARLVPEEPSAVLAHGRG